MTNPKPKQLKSMFIEQEQQQIKEMQKSSAVIASNKKQAEKEYQPINHASYSHMNNNHDRQQIHKECNQRIEQLEQNFKGVNQNSANLKKQNQELKNRVQKIQRDLQEKSMFLHRSQAMYNDQLNRAMDYKKQMQKLTANLRATSTLYKNSITAYESMKTHHRNNLSHEKEAMGKLIQFYEMQLYPKEAGGTKYQMMELIKQNEALRADTEGLLNKMVQKEEYHLNRQKMNEEEMMRLREQGQFGYEMCAKIEQTLKEYSKDEDVFYQRFLEVSEENGRLRLRVEQLDADYDKIYEEYCELKMIDDCTKRLEEESKALIKEYDARIVECRNQMAIRNEENEQKFQLRNKILTLEDTLIKKGSQLQIKDKNLKEKDQQLNSKDRMIESLKSQLKQTQLKSKNIKNQLQDTRKRLEQQQQIHKIQIKKLEHKQSNILIQRNQNQQKNYAFEPLLSTSEILDGNMRAFKQGIIALMQKTYSSSYPSKRIAKTRLIFRRDEVSRNFGQYFKEFTKSETNEQKQKHIILLLVRIDQNKLIGGFAPLTLSPVKQKHYSEPSFLFTYSEGKQIRKFSPLQGKTFQVLYALTYFQNKLQFGNNELSIRNANRQKQLELNNPFGTRYYNSVDRHDFLEDDGSSKIYYQQMEIFKVIFDSE